MMRGNQQTNHTTAMTARRNSGFSLIEIMIVLVVLLIGIFAIVRLFPPGFLTISRTAETTAAEALGKQQLDTARNAFSVPDSIVALDPSTKAIRSDIQPDDLTDYAVNDPALGGGDPYYFSNANHFTHIIAETFHISIPTSNSGGGQGAIYALQFGPVINIFGSAGGNPTDSLVVRGTSLQRTAQTFATSINNPTGTAVLDNEAQYAIDMNTPGGPYIAFYPRVVAGGAPVNTRLFTISYSYYSNASANVTVVTPSTPITISVPDVVASSTPAQPVWQHLFTNGADVPGYASNTAQPSDLIQVKPESEDVSRKFKLMSATPGAFNAWDANEPYEYAWYSPQVPNVNANVGVLIFNPAGYDQTATLSRGTQGLTARIDYSIFDNHILRDDRNLPAAGPYAFRLSIPFVYTSGDANNGGDVLDINASYNNFNSNLNPYSGIWRDGTQAVPNIIYTPDVLIYNMNTGAEIGNWTHGNGVGALATGPTNPTPFDPATGQIVLNRSYVESNGLQSASVRCFYRAHKDWGQQFQKASSHYGLASAANLTDYHTCFPAPAGSPFPTRIYFAMCDMGKTVVLGQYYDNSSGATSYTNEEYQISNDPSQFDAVNLPFIDTASRHSGLTGFNPVPTGLPVSNIQGVSVKSRIVWRAGSRWRKEDTDTFLTPPTAH